MLYSLLNVKKQAPEIRTLPASIQMIGVSLRTNPKTIFRDSQELGRHYARVKAAGLIQNKRDPWAFVAISKSFADDGSWEYLMSDVVTDLDAIPAGLTGFEIPAHRYARFALQPRFIWMWGLALGLLKKYIYSEWLPGSVYETNSAVLGDFEYHDKRSLGGKPQIDLYVAVKDKAR